MTLGKICGVLVDGPVAADDVDEGKNELIWHVVEDCAPSDSLFAGAEVDLDKVTWG